MNGKFHAWYKPDLSDAEIRVQLGRSSLPATRAFIPPMYLDLTWTRLLSRIRATARSDPRRILCARQEIPLDNIEAQTRSRWGAAVERIIRSGSRLSVYSTHAQIRICRTYNPGYTGTGLPRRHWKRAQGSTMTWAHRVRTVYRPAKSRGRRPRAAGMVPPPGTFAEFTLKLLLTRCQPTLPLYLISRVSLRTHSSARSRTLATRRYRLPWLWRSPNRSAESAA